VEVEATSTDVNEAAEWLPRVRGPVSVLGEGDDRRNPKKADYEHSTAHRASFKARFSGAFDRLHDRNYRRSTDSGMITVSISERLSPVVNGFST
jgi:hypothetical protein